MLLKKINLLFLILTLTIIKAEVKINDFEYNTNKVLLESVFTKIDSLMLDSNLFVGAFKEYNNKLIHNLFVEMKNKYKFLDKNCRLTKNNYKFDNNLVKKIKYSNLLILSNTIFYYSENLDKNMKIKNQNSNIDSLFLNLAFVKIDDKIEKILSIFITKNNYFDAKKLSNSLNIINDILYDPENIKQYNQKLYKFLISPNSNNELIMNYIKEFTANEYSLWTIGIGEDGNKTTIYFYFKDLFKNKLLIKLIKQNENENFSLDWIIIGNLENND